MDAITKKKIALQASSERHKMAINSDLNTLAVKTEEIAGNTALTIGILLAAVALYKMLKNKSVKGHSRNSNRLMRIVKQQAALYILTKGRGKIVDYINSLNGTES